MARKRYLPRNQFSRKRADLFDDLTSSLEVTNGVADKAFYFLPFGAAWNSCGVMVLMVPSAIRTDPPSVGVCFS